MSQFISDIVKLHTQIPMKGLIQNLKNLTLYSQSILVPTTTIQIYVYETEKSESYHYLLLQKILTSKIIESIITEETR